MTLRAGDTLEDEAVQKPGRISPASVMRAPGRMGKQNRITVRLVPASAKNHVERCDDRINVRIDARTTEPDAEHGLRSASCARGEVSCDPSLTQPLTGYDHLNAGVFHLHGEAYGPGARDTGTEREHEALDGARSHSTLAEEENGSC